MARDSSSQKGLRKKTSGYKNHPQLKRFKESSKPLDCINEYLSHIYIESLKRSYNFNKDKIDWEFKSSKLLLTKGQLNFEKEHLLKKLEIRDKTKYDFLIKETDIQAHPLFIIIDGDIESWEKT